MEDPHHVTDQKQVEAIIADLRRVMAYAGKLGLHGLIILSPICPKCGQLHTWSLLSDMLPGGPNETETAVRDLLQFHLDRVSFAEAVVLGPPANDA